MFRLLTFFVSAAALLGFVWFGLTVDLGERTLFGHLRAIGGSDEAQELWSGTKDKVTDFVGIEAARRAEAAARAAREAAEKSSASRHAARHDGKPANPANATKATTSNAAKATSANATKATSANATKATSATNVTTKAEPKPRKPPPGSGSGSPPPAPPPAKVSRVDGHARGYAQVGKGTLTRPLPQAGEVAQRK
jgi:hypothetical protein